MCLFLFCYTTYPLRTFLLYYVPTLRTHTKTIMCLYCLWHIICYMLFFYTYLIRYLLCTRTNKTSANLDPTSREFNVYYMHILWDLVLFWFNYIQRFIISEKEQHFSRSLFVKIIFNLFNLFFKYLDK